MENFIFSAEIVLPLFILIMIGYLLSRVGIFNANFLKTADSVCFRVLLPVLLFYNIYKCDFMNIVNQKLITFILIGILVVAFLGVCLVPMIVKNNGRRGTIIQMLYRGNYLLFGIPICQSIAGDEGAAIAAMIAAILIPVFNIVSVIILSIFGGRKKVKDRKSVV